MGENQDSSDQIMCNRELSELIERSIEAQKKGERPKDPVIRDFINWSDAKMAVYSGECNRAEATAAIGVQYERFLG